MRFDRDLDRQGSEERRSSLLVSKSVKEDDVDLSTAAKRQGDVPEMWVELPIVKASSLYTLTPHTQHCLPSLLPTPTRLPPNIEPPLPSRPRIHGYFE